MLFLLRLNREEARAGTEQMPCAVALDGLDFDDLGPHVGQHHAAAGAHDHVGELDDAQAFERELACRFGHAQIQR
jgi:hypothetical protein